MGGCLVLWHLFKCKEEIKRRKALRKTNRNENNPGPSGRRHHTVNVKTEKKDYEQSTCRVCLQYGDIPIYGVVDVSEELKLFTGIEITPGDSYPHYLCDFCSNQLEGAVTLRRSAQNSDRLLKQATQNIIINTVGEAGISIQANYGPCTGIISHLQENNNDDESDSIQESKENCNNWFYTTDQTENIKIHNVDEGEPKKKRRKIINKDSAPLSDMLPKFSEGKKPNVVLEEVKSKTFHCVKCNIDFESKKEYSKHKEAHRRQRDRNKKEPCPLCNKTFDIRGLKQHLKRHKQEKLFICDVCGKDFKNKTFFDRHCSTHFLTELPFKCPECPYQGLSRGELNFHMRIHTRDSQYQCPQCPTRFFINKSNLSRHMLTHRTDYDFNCDQCQRGFRAKNDLEEHIRVDHDGIKEHICKDCGRAYGFRSSLHKHQRRVHKRAKMRSGRMPLYLLLESRKQQEGKSLLETSGQDCNFEKGD